MSHIKRLFAPITWNIDRKEKTFVARPLPSGHKQDLSVPLVVVMRDLLGLVQSARELKTTLLQKEVLIDSRRQKDWHSPVGMFDVLDLPFAKEQFRMVLGKDKRLELVPITAKEKATKVCKVIRKNHVRGKKTQLTFHDGRTVLTEEKVKCNDSVLWDIKNKKIIEVLPFDKGSYVLVLRGKYASCHGVLKEVSQDTVMIEGSDKTKIETLKEYVVVVGKDKPFVTIENAK